MQFALAWLLAQRPFIVPIRAQLSANLRALNVRDTAEELNAFRSQLSQLKVRNATRMRVRGGCATMRTAILNSRNESHWCACYRRRISGFAFYGLTTFTV